MNRRKFLKSISSFLAAIPFVSFDELQYGEVDKSSLEGDYTTIMTIDNYAESMGILLFNNISSKEFEVAKEYYMKNVMQPDKSFFLVGSELEIEWIGFDEKL